MRSGRSSSRAWAPPGTRRGPSGPPGSLGPQVDQAAVPLRGRAGPRVAVAASVPGAVAVRTAAARLAVADPLAGGGLREPLRAQAVLAAAHHDERGGFRPAMRHRLLEPGRLGVPGA